MLIGIDIVNTAPLSPFEATIVPLCASIKPLSGRSIARWNRESMKNIGVIIPAFNAGATIGAVIAGIAEYISSENIIVVDDGSSDKTASVAVSFGAQVLKHSVNREKELRSRPALILCFKPCSTPSLRWMPTFSIRPISFRSLPASIHRASSTSSSGAGFRTRKGCRSIAFFPTP